MTEIRDEPVPQKTTDTKRIIEQIENCRVGLLREILGLGNKLKIGEDVLVMIKNDLKAIRGKYPPYILAFAVAMTIALGVIAYKLYKITDKLTALGL